MPCFHGTLPSPYEVACIWRWLVSHLTSIQNIESCTTKRDMSANGTFQASSCHPSSLFSTSVLQKGNVAIICTYVCMFIYIYIYTCNFSQPLNHFPGNGDPRLHFSGCLSDNDVFQQVTLINAPRHDPEPSSTCCFPPRRRAQK